MAAAVNAQDAPNLGLTRHHLKMSGVMAGEAIPRQGPRCRRAVRPSGQPAESTTRSLPKLRLRRDSSRRWRSRPLLTLLPRQDHRQNARGGPDRGAHERTGRCCALHLLLVGLMLASAGVNASAQTGVEEPVPASQYIVGKEIFENEQAAQLVKEARSYDPDFTPTERVDRDKAVAFYEQAMAAQPGGRMNPELAHRIAQLYTFYYAADGSFRHDLAKAAPWWRRTAELAKPQHELWAVARMGTASAAVMGGRGQAALDAYQTIVAWDAEHVELPDWRVWPSAEHEQTRALLERIQQQARQSARTLRALAVDQVYRVSKRLGTGAALAQLQDIAERYEGTAAAERARQLLDEHEPTSADDPLALSEELSEEPWPADGDATPAPSDEQLRAAYEKIPVRVRTLVEWANAGKPATARNVDEGERTRLARNTALSWVKGVIDPELRPPGEDALKPRLELLERDDGCDIIATEWEQDGLAFSVLQTHTFMTVTVRGQSGSSGEKGADRAAAMTLAGRVFGNHDEVLRPRGGVNVNIVESAGDSRAVLLDSLAKGDAEELKGGYSGAPRRIETAKDYSDRMWLWYWWRHVGWWSTPDAVVFYLPKISGGPFMASYNYELGDSHWFDGVVEQK